MPWCVKYINKTHTTCIYIYTIHMNYEYNIKIIWINILSSKNCSVRFCESESSTKFMRLITIICHHSTSTSTSNRIIIEVNSLERNHRRLFFCPSLSILNCKPTKLEINIIVYDNSRVYIHVNILKNKKWYEKVIAREWLETESDERKRKKEEKHTAINLLSCKSTLVNIMTNKHSISEYIE